jgi:DNA polymerase sigma
MVDPRETMSFLNSIEVEEIIKMKMKVAYLENIVQRTTENELHNQLISFYLDLIPLQKNENERDAIKQKLRDFLNKSQHYTPEKLLR